MSIHVPLFGTVTFLYAREDSYDIGTNFTPFSLQA
jgi:hypothetical protein